MWMVLTIIRANVPATLAVNFAKLNRWLRCCTRRRLPASITTVRTVYASSPWDRTIISVNVLPAIPVNSDE